MIDGGGSRSIEVPGVLLDALADRLASRLADRMASRVRDAAGVAQGEVEDDRRGRPHGGPPRARRLGRRGSLRWRPAERRPRDGEGGPNLVAACWACNSAKADLLLEEVGWELLSEDEVRSDWDGLTSSVEELWELAGSPESLFKAWRQALM